MGKFIGLPVKLSSDPSISNEVCLDSPLMYIDSLGEVWEALPGLMTDGKSVPPLFWVLVGDPFDPKTLPAAIIHDQYCIWRTRTAKRTHEVFGEMLRDLNNPPIQTKLMAWAVRWFGPKW